MSTKIELEQAVKDAKATLNAVEAALEAFIESPENNVFATLEEAEGVLEDRLRDRAHADCEGSYNCGDSSYQQDFIVDGVTYRATLTVDYNRHDKTYYYVDGTDFKVEPL